MLKEAGVETEGRIFIAKGAYVVTDLRQLVGEGWDDWVR